jgi:release factor glutamine methyltransferase
MTPAKNAPARWTTRSLLAWMRDAFTKAGIDSPRLCSEMLLAHVLGCDRLRLYMEADRPASPEERDRLRDLVARALRHEPVQYLVGEAWFYSLPFHVDRRVLIPRPSSETIVELVLRHARAEPGFDRARFADVGVGSGCLSVAILKNLPEARGIGVDISANAIEVAKANAERHAVADRLSLLEGDLLEPLAPQKGELHYLLANPPYIPDREWPDVEANVKDHEPATALRGGADGLSYVRPILEGAGALLRKGGLLAVEIAAATRAEALEIARAQTDLLGPRVEDDADGLPRVLVATRR